MRWLFLSLFAASIVWQFTSQTSAQDTTVGDEGKEAETVPDVQSDPVAPEAPLRPARPEVDDLFGEPSPGAIPLGGDNLFPLEAEDLSGAPNPVDGPFNVHNPGEPGLNPATFPATSLNFGQIVAAKIQFDHDPPQMFLMVESYRHQWHKTEIMVSQPIEVTQSYTTSEGTTAERQVTVKKLVPTTVETLNLRPAGLKPIVMNLSDFEFYDLDSKPVSHPIAAKRLTKLVPVFLLESFQEKFQPLGKYERDVLKDDVLIATTKKRVHQPTQFVRGAMRGFAFDFPAPAVPRDLFVAPGNPAIVPELILDNLPPIVPVQK